MKIENYLPIYRLYTTYDKGLCPKTRWSILWDIYSMYKRQKSKMKFMRPSFQRRARRTGISFRYHWMGSFFISDEMTSQNKRDSKLWLFRVAKSSQFGWSHLGFLFEIYYYIVIFRMHQELGTNFCMDLSFQRILS